MVQNTGINLYRPEGEKLERALQNTESYAEQDRALALLNDPFYSADYLEGIDRLAPDNPITL